MSLEIFNVREGTTPDYTALLVDKNDVPVPGSVLDSVILTYYQEYTGEIINGREKQNISQANNWTFDDDGNIVWHMQPGDSVILDDRLSHEPHIALLEFTYAGVNGTEYGKFQFRVLVENIEKVPA